MKRRVLDFIDLLRREGLSPSPGETLDALRAVAAAGVERAVLRAGLAATLVKDHGLRPAFDAAFDRFFALRERPERKRKTARSVGGGDGGRSGAPARGRGEAPGRSPQPEAPRRREAERRDAEPRPSDGREAQDKGPSDFERSAARLAERRALLAKPFREMDPREVEELRDLARELAMRFRRRFSRRRAAGKRGRLDIRRTLRRALSRGGVPLELLLRRPRPGRADLVALVDLSFSTAAAADFLLALLGPAQSYFRRTTFLAYIDRPVEISFANGHVVPHAPLDLGARSDFGRVLTALESERRGAFGRDTVLLVLGDARNNRRPPRADILARLRRAARAIVWLNPEPRERWDTGDSVMAAYARHTDAVLAADTPAALATALARFAAATMR